jgi:hypothetical protein
MFAAYALQVRYRPYMSPGKYENVILWHKEKLRFGVVLNQQIENDIKREWHFQGVRDKEKNRGKLNKFKSTRMADGRNNAASVVSSGKKEVPIIQVSYNAIEMTMLGSTVLICLAGVCFQSLESEVYRFARRGLTFSTISLIILSTAFFFTVVGVELFSNTCKCCRRKVVSAL